MIKILVIEDEATIRENVREILEFEGFDVYLAENGKIGIQLLKQELPDLVICDIMMPERDGYQVLQELQQDPITTNIPLIFLTAKVDRSDLRHGMELGANDYLTKPFTPNELIKAIAIRLQKKSYELIQEERLTHRQLEILKLVAKGLTTKEIADELYISVKTVETHRGQIMERLDIHNLAGLIRHALHIGLIGFDN